MFTILSANQKQNQMKFVECAAPAKPLESKCRILAAAVAAAVAVVVAVAVAVVAVVAVAVVLDREVVSVFIVQRSIANLGTQSQEAVRSIVQSKCKYAYL
jgi:hypothetical protein